MKQILVLRTHDEEYPWIITDMTKLKSKLQQLQTVVQGLMSLDENITGLEYQLNQFEHWLIREDTESTFFMPLYEELNRCVYEHDFFYQSPTLVRNLDDEFLTDFKVSDNMYVWMNTERFGLYAQTFDGRIMSEHLSNNFFMEDAI